MAIALVFLIWAGRITGLYDPGGRDFPEVQDRHLTVSGVVAGREASAGNSRIILHSLSFLPDRTDAYREPIRAMNDRLHDSDRMLVCLASGEDSDTDLYGGDISDSVPYARTNKKDQTDLFLSLHIGDIVMFRGKCAEPQRATNPGQFDMCGYDHARNIYFTMRDAELIQSCRTKLSLLTPWNKARDILWDLRFRMQKGLAEVFGQEDASYMAAILLGDRSGLTEEGKRLFQDGGLAWLLAVSSLHITLAGRGMYRLLRRLRRSFVFASVFALFTVLSCLILTGGTLSAQRACIMFTFWLGSQILGRTEDRLTSLGAAAILILTRQPYALFESSFQISCICILSMELLPGAVRKAMGTGSPALAAGMKQPDGWVAAASGSLLRSASIQTGILPVMLWWFYQISPYGILLHPVLLPAMTLLVGFGLSGALCGALLTAAGIPFPMHTLIHAAGLLLTGPCHYLITFFLVLCRIMQDLPGSVLILGRPDLMQVVLYYILLGGFLLVMKRRDPAICGNTRAATGCGTVSARKSGLSAKLTVLFLTVMMITMLIFRRRPAFRYTCLDVGQGSCSLIECGDYVCLFDAGSSSVQDVWKYRIDSTLKYYGISEIDTVFLSHGDMDHINGIGQMFSAYHRNLAGENAGDVSIRQLCLPDLPAEDEQLTEIREAAERLRIPVGYVSEGSFVHEESPQNMASDNLKLCILSPSEGRLTGNGNEDCIVMQVSYRNVQILLTGDLELEGEEQFVKHYAQKEEIKRNTDVDDGIYRILNAGHHGSRNATSEAMLKLVQPDLVIISCGKNNRYGHPSEEMLQRLEEYGTAWKRTDLDGAFCLECG